jgi:hypothetical protein
VNRAAIIGDLLRRASLTPPDLLAADVANALHDAGGNHLVLYVVDYEQETLQPVALASDLLDDAPKGVNIEGTMAGRSFQTQQVLSADTAQGWRVWAPVRERAERIGVLELGFPAVDDDLLALCDDLGLLVGHLTHTAGRYTDLIELRRRRRPMNLAAEMQWDLLPPLSFTSPELAIAGLLEPAYFVAGDAFDYSLHGDLHWINAGHPPPLLIRGSKVVGEMSCEPCLPFGIGISITEIGHCRLQPGDRVLFYSDGATEARPAGGEQFGVDRLTSEVEQYLGAGVLPSETLRRLAARLRQHRGGELEDDATLVFLEWQPGA